MEKNEGKKKGYRDQKQWTSKRKKSVRCGNKHEKSQRSAEKEMLERNTYFINEQRLRSRVDALFVPLFLSLDFVLFTCKVLSTSQCNVAPPSAVPLIIGHMQRSTVYKKNNIRSTAGLPRARAGLLHFKVQWEYCM